METYRRRLAATGLRRPARRVRVPAPGLLRGTSAAKLGRRLHGRRLTHTHRHGKYLFAAAEDDGWLVLHFGMTGELRHLPPRMASPAHTGLELELQDGSRLAYIAPRKLGLIGFTADAKAYVRAHGLGPDALAIDEEAFRRQARRRRGGVKAWLMDQAALAGIGNVYSDEILFQARLHPRAAVAGLDGRDLRRLYKAMRAVLTRAVEAGAEPAHMPRAWLLTYRSEGGRCPRCGEALTHTRAAGRRAWFCPRCQRGPATDHEH